MIPRTLLFLPLILAVTASRAGDAPPTLANGCPPLMTDRECTDYANTLTRLQPGQEREAFLMAHVQLMREREKACSCSRHLEAVARVAPNPAVEAARYRF